MPLRSDLAAGFPGIRWSIPEDFETAKDERRLTLVRDPHRKVSWFVRIFPWRFDLREAFDGALRADLEADARHLFEKTLASFTRVGIGEAPLRLLDVWRLEQRIAGRDRARELQKLAVETTAAWKNEGVTDLDQEAEVIGVDGPQAAVRSFARFKVGESEKASAMRWRADEDGTVFRVCVGAERYVPESELREQAEEVMASLRRLDPVGTPRGPGKPWWKLW